MSDDIDGAPDIDGASDRRRPENRALRARIDALKQENEAHAVALTELRHRFANCFQLLSALVRLRRKQTASAAHSADLAWVEQVVVTLGLLQQQLSVVGSGPAFRLFLAEQACLWRSLGAEQGVDMRIDVDEIEVAADKAVPLALILNELVMNCLEHAFPGGRGGTIHIELKRSGEDQGALTVADDGIGVPRSGRVRGSLGLTLIERLSEQTGGSFSIERTDGTIARIHFPLR